MNKIRYYSNFFMIAVYVGLGLLFFFTDIGSDMFPNYRQELGITMLIYSVVRTGLIIWKHKKEQKNEF